MTDRNQQAREQGPHPRHPGRALPRRGLRRLALLVLSLPLAWATAAAPAVAVEAAQAQPAPGVAGGASGDPAGKDLAAECQRLRQELARANAEISSMKQGDRGVRDDYRLRRRMADAEQLARQLTTAEAQLRRLRGPAPTAPVPAAQLGQAQGQAQGLSPTEAPGMLEARADLLSDQARRLNREAAGLEQAATQLRTRQTLRQRAGQVERDPFGSMDASKRFMVVRRAQEGGTDLTGGGSNTFKGTPTSTPTPTSGQGSSESAPGGAGLAPATTPTPPTSPPPSPPPTAAGTPTAGDSSGGGPGRSSGTPTVNPTTGSPTRASEITSRTLLDPAIAAELKRIDAASGAPGSEAERLQRAAAALSKRAQTLEAEARALRARAHKR